ncbi:uncharacterized protein LOC110376243 isoform X2 [Helicoverpa armigera]|uniref:uncharacterized protein LOC110376243 isoform X2 n=1 Tax=Helicoverpa armigera TaxID=29058 RepID=UPI00211271AF|nr:uncharacterized protein LOC110376243 isoform X2 [Helicoverpa armigera]
MDKKRERASNFDKAETRLLTELVTKYKYIIENKKTDAVTNKDKEAAWGRIASSFNATTSGTTTRSSKTLKLKYEGIKKATKKKMSCRRQELYRTGGGPSNAPDFDDVEEKVLAICSNITGLEARNDSDNISDVIQSASVPLKIDLSQDDLNLKFKRFQETIQDSDIQIVMLNQETDDSYNKWGTWNPKALKSKINPVLKPTKASVTAKIDELSATRLELVHLQQEIAKKEHYFVEQEHELKMTHLRNEEIRKQELHNLMLKTMQQKD